MLEAKKEMNLDLEQISQIWQHRSVVRSWLLDLIADAFADDKKFSALSNSVDDSGEGRWTAQDSIDLAVPTPYSRWRCKCAFAADRMVPLQARY